MMLLKELWPDYTYSGRAAHGFIVYRWPVLQPVTTEFIDELRRRLPILPSPVSVRLVEEGRAVDFAVAIDPDQLPAAITDGVTEAANMVLHGVEAARLVNMARWIKKEES